MADEIPSSYEDLSPLTFIKRGGGTILLRAGYQYILKEKYKNGTAAWECINRRKTKCCGKVTLKGHDIVGEKKHECPPDYRKNKSDETFYLNTIKKEFEIIQSKRGKPALEMGNYKYLYHSKCGPKIRWTCDKQRRLKCNVTIITVEDQIIRVKGEHIH